MSQPLKAMPDILRRSAVLSECLLYRYELRRVWDDRLPLLVVCMVNPSNADHERDDPTVLALIWFANQWGYGGILIVNLYAYRSPSPDAMFAYHSNVGPENGRYIEEALAYARANGRRLLVAWGNDGDREGRAEWFASRAVMAHGLELVCLGRTRSGAPKHPMARGKHRIARDQQPLLWRLSLDAAQAAISPNA